MTPDKRYPSDLTDEEWAIVQEWLHLEYHDDLGFFYPHLAKETMCSYA